ncbi:MAG: 3'-5' exonuclease [Cyclobacteriaceae bacterium]
MHDHILVIDIETVSATATLEELDPRLQKQWERKCKWIQNPEELLPEELYKKRAGIYAEFGRVVCISLGFFSYLHSDGSNNWQLRVKAIYNDDEKALLQEFAEMISSKFDQRKTRFVSHNGKEFDLPFLCRRMLINGIALPDILQLAGKKPWENPHIDTLENWKFGDYKHYTSLELLTALFDIPTSKDDIDGSMVSQVYYEQGDLNRIAEYCCNDVVATAQLYLRMNLQALIAEENIHIV